MTMSDQTTTADEQVEQPVPAPAPKAFRPLLLGLGVMMAGLYAMIDAKGALGASLISATAQGTMVIVGVVALVVCGVILDVYAGRHLGERLPLAPVMGASTVLLALCGVLATAFVQMGGRLVGTVPGGLFLMLAIAGICGGVGVSLAFSGWHTCVLGASWVYGFVYLVLSAVLGWLIVMACRAVTGVVACAVVGIALVIVGAGMLHVQVRFLDGADGRDDGADA